MHVSVYIYMYIWYIYICIVFRSRRYVVHHILHQVQAKVVEAQLHPIHSSCLDHPRIFDDFFVEVVSGESVFWGILKKMQKLLGFLWHKGPSPPKNITDSGHHRIRVCVFWAWYFYITLLHLIEFSAQIIATSAEVTPNGGLVREYPSKPLIHVSEL